MDGFRSSFLSLLSFHPFFFHFGPWGNFLPGEGKRRQGEKENVFARARRQRAFFFFLVVVGRRESDLPFHPLKLSHKEKAGVPLSEPSYIEPPIYPIPSPKPNQKENPRHPPLSWPFYPGKQGALGNSELFCLIGGGSQSTASRAPTPNSICVQASTPFGGPTWNDRKCCGLELLSSRTWKPFLAHSS